MLKSHVRSGRPPFERIALLLQGGGALGSYQGGVYQALAEANIELDWVAGISIGAINSALIAGNPAERRVERLREFWEIVSTSPIGLPSSKSIAVKGEFARRIAGQLCSLGVVLDGAPGFFKLRFPPPYLLPSGAEEALSYYDVTPLKETLERLVDFDLINAQSIQLSVGVTNVQSGNFVYFDNTTQKIRPEHIMASAALPPGFPPIEIEGEYYWDGGIVSNTPLQWVLDGSPRKDTLAFQVDLWSARGDLPRDLVEVELRQKEIRFSSRTRQGTDGFKKAQILRRAVGRLLQQIPGERRNELELQILEREADEKVYNIVHLIYRAQNSEGPAKDIEFSRPTMEEHWRAGYNDTVRTLRHPEVLERPQSEDGVSTFDLSRDGRD
ncbi:NTE family protein [Methylocapsa palsarum]|uniref:NTE family protein n=2 Tax=Methylocapsa palsarum TaxID=1612308 RepID=A0A1I3YE24_9HYPH|nr:NTE family protein [Methylocapsa palsarum]